MDTYDVFILTVCIESAPLLLHRVTHLIFVTCIQFEFNDTSLHTKNNSERRRLTKTLFFDVAIKVIYFTII